MDQIKQKRIIKRGMIEDAVISNTSSGRSSRQALLEISTSVGVPRTKGY